MPAEKAWMGLGLECGCFEVHKKVKYAFITLITNTKSHGIVNIDGSVCCLLLVCCDSAVLLFAACLLLFAVVFGSRAITAQLDRDTFEFDQGHVTTNQPGTVLVLLSESKGI